MSGGINAYSVRIRHGKKLVDGKPVYGNLQKVMECSVPTIDNALGARVTLTTSSEVDVQLLDNPPTGKVFIDGSTYEAITGGLACTTVAGSLGTNETTTNEVGGRIVNMVKILDSDKDEQLEIQYEAGELTTAKYVYGLLQTTIGDGQDTQANQIQVSFVIYDDTTDSLTSVTIPAGTYYFQPVRMYTLATSAEANRLASMLAGDGTLGGVGLEELKELLSTPAGFTQLRVDSEMTLDSSVITIAITGATSTEWKDSAGATISGAATQSGRKVFSADSINELAYVKEGVTVRYNGVAIPIDNVKVKDTTTIEVDLKDSNTMNFLFEGDILELIW